MYEAMHGNANNHCRSTSQDQCRLSGNRILRDFVRVPPSALAKWRISIMNLPVTRYSQEFLAVVMKKMRNFKRQRSY